jgi:hypothetical protein
VAVIAAIIHIVRAVQSCEKLQQKASFIAAPAAKVPERLVSHERLKLSFDPFESLSPSNSAVGRITLFIENWLNESSARFHLTRGVVFHQSNRVLCPEVSGNRWLHIGGHRLDGFFANFWKRSVFVYHSTMLSTHAECASLACIARSKRSIEFPEPSRLDTFTEGVSHCLPAAASGKLSHN